LVAVLDGGAVVLEHAAKPVTAMLTNSVHKRVFIGLVFSSGVEATQLENAPRHE